MTERTTTTSVTFHMQAIIDGLTEPLPPGVYVVETDEEQILGLSHVAYRRLRTSIVVPARVGTSTARQMVEINPESLAAALKREAQCDARAGGVISPCSQASRPQ